MKNRIWPLLTVLLLLSACGGPEAERLQIEEAKRLIDPDSTGDFYLTGDTLGLVGMTGRYPFYMEAPLSALGLEEWAA